MPTSDTTPADIAGPLLLPADDIIQALARRHPAADLKIIEEAGRAVALISRAVLNDAAAIRALRDIGDDAMFDIVHDMRADIESRSAQRIRLPGDGPPEVSRGSGLGEVVGAAAWRVRLAAHADAVRLEAWAGPVASAKGLSDREGISAPQLRAWRRTRAVVELSDERRRPVFPLRQFVHRHPVPRLTELQDIVGDPRIAWLWLIEPSHGGEQSWLDMLKEGRTAQVLEAAREDFA